MPNAYFLQECWSADTCVATQHHARRWAPSTAAVCLAAVLPMHLLSQARRPDWGAYARDLRDRSLYPKCSHGAAAATRMPRASFCGGCCVEVAILGVHRQHGFAHIIGH